MRSKAVLPSDDRDGAGRRKPFPLALQGRARIVAAAVAQGCAVARGEDRRHHRNIVGVRVVDSFAAGPERLDAACTRRLLPARRTSRPRGAVSTRGLA
jgi:hypothetical protein